MNDLTLGLNLPEGWENGEVISDLEILKEICSRQETDNSGMDRVIMNYINKGEVG